MAPSARQAVTAGAVLAETYEVTRLLGEGGMGSVWEARHLRLERKKVAIKVLHGFVAGDGEAVGRFQREANIASRLGHPNIIQVHDFNTLPGGAPYLVLEYLDGESLNERLRRGPLPLPHALAIARQIGSALQAAHAEGIVHRDLKPHNVFLCPSESHGYATEQVKVLDFGISKIQGSDTVKTQTNAILGTPQYMSPEQAKGAHRDIDHRTDVFAMGAMVYEMLTGRAAFLGDSIPEVMFKVVYEEPPPLAGLVPGLPANVVAAVEHALVKNRDQRCASAAAFVEALTGDPLNTLRGGPATATVHSPMLSASLAAAAASKHLNAAKTPNMRAASPEAFAATMATGGGHQPPEAFGATMASINAPGSAPGGAPGAPAAHVSMMAATASQPHAAGPGAGHSSGPLAQPYMASPALLGQLPAHAYGVADTAPVVDRPRHVPRRRVLPFVVGGVALIASIAVAFLVVRTVRSDDDGTSTTASGATGAPTQPAAGNDQPSAHTTGAGTTDPGQTAAASGADTPAAGNDTDTPDPDDPDAPATADTTGQKRDPDTRPPRTEEDLPAEVKQELTEAEGMIESKPDAAISRARKILGTRKDSSLAAAIMTRAYCVKGDLGSANGSFSRVRDRRLKRAVQRFCKDKSVDLQD